MIDKVSVANEEFCFSLLVKSGIYQNSTTDIYPQTKKNKKIESVVRASLGKIEKNRWKRSHVHVNMAVK